MKIILIFGLLYIHATNGLIVSNRTCEMEGQFPIVDGTCQNFQVCINNGFGLVSLEMTCKSPALFNSGTSQCDSTFSCDQTPPTTVTQCKRYGRFEITDPNCQKYYLCFWDGTAYQRWNMSCPNSLRFDPSLEKCTLPQNYPCTGF